MSENIEQALATSEQHTKAMRWIATVATGLIGVTATAVIGWSQLVNRVEGLDRYGSGWTQEQVRAIDAKDTEQDRAISRLVALVEQLDRISERMQTRMERLEGRQ